MTIKKLSHDLEAVHCIDLAIELGVARATVSRMIQYLVEQQFVIKKQRCLSLSPQGEALLESELKQYTLLHEYFASLGLASEQCAACTEALIGHVSPSTLEKLCQIISKKT